MSKLTLNDNYNGKTLLKTWWKIIRDNLQLVKDWTVEHINGTGDKHNATDVIYSGDVAGAENVKQGLDNLKKGVDDEAKARNNADKEIGDAFEAHTHDGSNSEKVSYGDLKNIPTQFTPAAHTHNGADIDDYSIPKQKLAFSLPSGGGEGSGYDTELSPFDNPAEGVRVHFKEVADLTAEMIDYFGGAGSVESFAKVNCVVMVDDTEHRAIALVDEETHDLIAVVKS